MNKTDLLDLAVLSVVKYAEIYGIDDQEDQLLRDYLSVCGNDGHLPVKEVVEFIGLSKAPIFSELEPPREFTYIINSIEARLGVVIVVNDEHEFTLDNINEYFEEGDWAVDLIISQYDVTGLINISDIIEKCEGDDLLECAGDARTYFLSVNVHINVDLEAVDEDTLRVIAKEYVSERAIKSHSNSRVDSFNYFIDEDKIIVKSC